MKPSTEQHRQGGSNAGLVPSKTSCPSCGLVMALRVELIDRPLRCPKCQAAFKTNQYGRSVPMIENRAVRDVSSTQSPAYVPVEPKPRRRPTPTKRLQTDSETIRKTRSVMVKRMRQEMNALAKEATSRVDRESESAPGTSRIRRNNERATSRVRRDGNSVGVITAPVLTDTAQRQRRSTRLVICAMGGVLVLMILLGMWLISPGAWERSLAAWSHSTVDSRVERIQELHAKSWMGKGSVDPIIALSQYSFGRTGTIHIPLASDENEQRLAAANPSLVPLMQKIRHDFHNGKLAQSIPASTQSVRLHWVEFMGERGTLLQRNGGSRVCEFRGTLAALEVGDWTSDWRMAQLRAADSLGLYDGAR